ncbi:MAG: putative MFS family arabinose efflux permease [Acidimicrobiales bacterium]|jgi:predicted MFS family arabinose efflux permease
MRRQTTLSGNHRPSVPGRISGLTAVALIALGAAVAQAFGRFTYGVLLPAVRDDLNISNTVAGSLGTSNVAAYLIGTIAVAWATSRFRLLQVLRLGFVFSASGLLLAAYSPTVVVLAVAQFLMGLGGACIWIPSPVIAADAMPPERRSIAIALLSSGIGAGVVFSGQLSGFVRSTMGDDSWRTVYAIEAVIAVVVLLTTFALIGHSQGQPSARAGVGGFSALRRMRGWLPLTMAYTSFGLMYLLVIGFLTTRLEDDKGWTGSQTSLAFTLLGVAMIFGGPVFVSLASRIGPRLAMAMAFGTWGVLAIAVLPGWTVPTFGMAIGFGLLFTAVPSIITLYVVTNTTADTFGPSFSAATLAFGVAQMAAPQLAGFIADLAGSFAPVFLLSSFLAFVGMVSALRLPEREPAVTSVPASA